MNFNWGAAFDKMEVLPLANGFKIRCAKDWVRVSKREPLAAGLFKDSFPFSKPVVEQTTYSIDAGGKFEYLKDADWPDIESLCQYCQRRVDAVGRQRRREFENKLKADGVLDAD